MTNLALVSNLDICLADESFLPKKGQAMRPFWETGTPML
jgi:hypothetical protein